MKSLMFCLRYTAVDVIADVTMLLWWLLLSKEKKVGKTVRCLPTSVFYQFVKNDSAYASTAAALPAVM